MELNRDVSKDTFTLCTQFVANPRIEYTFIDEEAVLMGTEGDLLFGINAVGSEIWKQLQLQPVSVEDLSQHLVAYFEVSELRCLTDTKEFIDKLFSQNLILKVN